MDMSELEARDRGFGLVQTMAFSLSLATVVVKRRISRRPVPAAIVVELGDFVDDCGQALSREDAGWSIEACDGPATRTSDEVDELDVVVVVECEGGLRMGRTGCGVTAARMRGPSMLRLEGGDVDGGERFIKCSGEV